MVLKPPRKRRIPLGERWLVFCDNLALRLADERNLPPDANGLSLIVSALLVNIRSRFYRRPRAGRPESEDAAGDIEGVRGIGGVIELAEYLVGSFLELVQAAATWCYRVLVPESLLRSTERRVMKASADTPQDGEQGVRGIGRVIELAEYLVGSFFELVQAAGTWCYRILVPESLLRSTERVVMEASVDTIQDVDSWFHRLVARYTPKALHRWLLFFPDIAHACYSFSMAWSRSRSWKKLWWATPVLVFAVPLVGALTASFVESNTARVSHYRTALSQAVKDRDEQAEAIYLQKLQQLGDRRIDRSEFATALAMAEDPDKWEQAVTRIRELAPLASPGLAEAHLWLAEQLILSKIDAEDRWQEIETHAKHALELSAGHRRGNANSARWYLARVMDYRGQRDEAQTELEDLSADMPRLHFELMQRAIENKDRDALRKHARRVISICRELSKVDDSATEPEMTQFHFRAWVLATQFLDDAPAAVSIARQGMERYPQDTFLVSYVANSLARDIDDVELTSDEALRDLRELLQLQPNNFAAVERLKDLAEDDPAAAKSVTRALTATQSMPVALVLRMGDRRWEGEDAQGALWFYRSAAEVAPDSVAAWNNIAWLCGCREETLDLELALQAANRALELDDDPRCYETRGQIHFRLKRWPEAIADLKRALNGSLPDSKPAHASLAVAYAAVGDKEAAAAHRRKASSD